MFLPTRILVFLIISYTACNCNVSALDSSSAMKCTSQGDKIICQIVLDHPFHSATSENSEEESEWHLTHCSEDFDDAICLDATITKISKNQKEKPANIPIELMDDYVKVKVGTQTYKDPLDQYGTLISKALEKIRKVQHDQVSSSRYGTLDCAEAYAALAFAHLGETADGDDLTTSFVRTTTRAVKSLSAIIHEWSGQEAENAMHAFLEAFRLYEKVLQDLKGGLSHATGGRDDVDVSIQTASVAFYLGILYSKQYAYNEIVDSISATAAMENALSYLTKSSIMFERLLLLQDGGDSSGTRRSRRLLTTKTYVELSCATTKMRIAKLRMERSATSSLSEDAATMQMMSTSDADNDRRILRFGGNNIDDIKEAYRNFEDSIHLYKKALTRGDSTFVGQILTAECRLLLAEALMNAGTARTYTGDAEKAITHLEEAVVLYKQLTKVYPEYNSVAGDLLFNLSDLYLQLGMYDETNARYEAAMILFEVHPPMVEMPKIDSRDLSEVQESIQMYEKSLKEYHDTLFNGREVPAYEVPIPIEYHQDGEYYYEPDELYLADLHATLGALKMSLRDYINEDGEALGHFIEAVELYTNNISEGSTEARAVADVQLNMASMFFQTSEFQDSERAHRQAVEIYRSAIPEGKNPLMDEEFTDDLEDMMSSMEVPLQKREKDNKKKEKLQSETIAVHEALINLDDYEKKMLNGTKKDAFASEL